MYKFEIKKDKAGKFRFHFVAPNGQIMFQSQAYAEKHNLLTSSGSDSHGPGKKPIKYRAELSRALLERLGIRIT